MLSRPGLCTARQHGGPSARRGKTTHSITRSRHSHFLIIETLAIWRPVAIWVEFSARSHVYSRVRARWVSVIRDTHVDNYVTWETDVVPN